MLQTIPNDFVFDLAFTTARAGSDPGIFNVLAPTLLTAPVAGWYQISGNVRWQANSDGYRALQIALGGGGPVIAITVQNAVADPIRTFQSVSTLWYLEEGQSVVLQVQQDSGVVLDIEDFEAYTPEFGMARVAEGTPPP